MLYRVTANNSDFVGVSIDAIGPSGVNYRLELVHVAIGAFRVRLTNISAGALGEAVVVNFVVIKGASA